MPIPQTEALLEVEASQLKIGEWTLLELACQAVAETGEDRFKRVLWLLRYSYIVGRQDGAMAAIREFDEALGRALPLPAEAEAAQHA